jgi:hypothetical protein
MLLSGLGRVLSGYWADPDGVLIGSRPPMRVLGESQWGPCETCFDTSNTWLRYFRNLKFNMIQ